MKNFLFIALVLIGTGSVSAQSKIAHLNSQEIMEAMPSYKEAVIKLQNFEKEAYAELQVMKADFDKALQVHNQKLKDGSYSPVLQQAAEQKLGKKDQDLTARQQSLQTEMQDYSQELNQPILMKVEKAVKVVSDRNKYDYVFDVSTLIIHNGPDITKKVIAEILKLENPSATPPPPIKKVKP